MLIDSKKQLVPANIEQLNAYTAGKTIAEVREKYHLSRISKLASNENRLGCSPKVYEAVREAVQEIQDYPDSVSRLLRGELARKFNVKPENVIAGAGSESLLSNIMRTFFRDHEEALTADATFVGFFVQANIHGVRYHEISLTDDYRFDLDALLEAITPNTKLIYIANPNNPTGTYVTREEFERFMRRIPDDMLVVMDEAYYEFASEELDYPDSLEYRFDNVITLRTFSKAYGLAGLRVGYGLGAASVIQYMQKTKLTFEPNALAQAGALAAMKDQDFLNKSIEMVYRGRERLYDIFDRFDLHYVRSYSNSVMVIFESKNEAASFTEEMIKKGVILRQLQAFGLPHCVRITVGTEKELDHLEQSLLTIR